MSVRSYAERYHVACEAYDRTVCTGPVLHGAVLPATRQEYRLINAHALEVLQRVQSEAAARGFTQMEVTAAIQAWRPLMDDTRNAEVVRRELAVELEGLHDLAAHLRSMGYASEVFTLCGGVARCIVVENEHGNDIQCLWVEQAFRGRGYARELIGRVQEHYPRLTLTCSGELKAMYEKFGFVSVEEVPINSVRMRWAMFPRYT